MTDTALSMAWMLWATVIWFASMKIIRLWITTALRVYREVRQP